MRERERNDAMGKMANVDCVVKINRMDWFIGIDFGMPSLSKLHSTPTLFHLLLSLSASILSSYVSSLGR